MRARSLTLRALLAVAVTIFSSLAAALFAGVASGADIEMPAADRSAPIVLEAGRGSSWRQGAYEVWLLTGGCALRQGGCVAVAENGVAWVEKASPHGDEPHRLICYLEGVGQSPVRVDYYATSFRTTSGDMPTQSLVDKSYLGRWESESRIDVLPGMTIDRPPTPPEFFTRALAARHSDSDVAAGSEQVERIQTTQWQAPAGEGAVIPPAPPAPSQLPSPSSGAAPFGPPILTEEIPAQGALVNPLGDSAVGPPAGRSVQVRSRSSVPMQAQIFPREDETVAIITSGVNILIRGLDRIDQFENIGVIDIETDRVVIWTRRLGEGDLAGGGFDSSSAPVEFYLEGNIVFRQGDRVIYADRMYYNVNQELGVILNAEALTPIDEYQGLVRLKADVLQQVNSQSFVAHGAAITSSRLGVPRYWLQSETLTFEDRQEPIVDPFTGAPVLNPKTGEPAVQHNLDATSRNNYIFFGGVPIFYWPVLASNLTEPTYYLERFSIKNDNVFGTQVLTTFNAYQLLGLRDAPEGTEWDISLDYLSDRGFGAGTRFDYQRENLFGLSGPYAGFIDAWGIHDTGFDNLGADRRMVPLETDWRGRVLGRHRHELPNDFRLQAEIGAISDRNFLEQYYEREWDTFKDESTDIELRQIIENSSWNIYGQVRLNDFFTQTEWLPRADHFLMGQSLLWDRLTWYGHSHVGYARLETAEPPENPVDLAKFDPLAWESDAQGVRLGTRQELDLPLDLGPFTFTPYVLGDATHWGEDLNREEVTRLYGQAGLRASLPMWSVDPTVRSTLFNLNGLAHKVVFTADMFYADADQDLDRFPLYDQLDDDAQEQFRRRFYFDTFNGVPGGNVPLRFDERYYALRTGMQGWVSAPSMEIADDLTVARLGVRQRWQTKRGAPGRERIVDWITFDVEGSIFPDAERDNFGETLGLVDYDMKWRVGDRFSVLSDGFFDFFSDGLRTASIGGLLTRPERGELYLGYRSIEGPFSSHILNGSLGYRMSEKWIATAAASIDLGSTGNVTQSLSFTRVGESLLIRAGASYDRGRDNLGFFVGIEPRFLPSSRLGRVGGVQIPPAGARGLE